MKWNYNGKEKGKLRKREKVHECLLYTCYINYIAELQMVCKVQERVVPVSTHQWPRSLTKSGPKDRKIICYKFPNSNNAFIME
jgi:hypothetical protein